MNLLTKRSLGGLAALAAAAAMMAPGAAFAQGGRGPGGGGGETTLGNNLSAPAIFVPSSTAAGAPALRVPCGPDTTPQAPTGATSVQFPGYWLQKTESTWSATCATAASASVTAQWGANLTDAPSVAAGKPVRVEVGLLDMAATGADWQGFVITNLTPELADRLATYGTDGATFSAGVDGAPYTRVWGTGTTLTITDLSPGGASTTYTMTAEINSTGAVVYGFNWGSKGKKNTPSAGTYLLTFHVDPAVAITGVVAGAVNSPTYSTSDNTTSLQITLTPANRGGGHGRGR